MERKGAWLLLRLTVRGSILFLVLLWFVHTRMSAPQSAAPAETGTFLEQLARKSGASERQVRQILEELGPAVARELRAGNQIRLPGLGRFRLVTVPAHQRWTQQTNTWEVVPAVSRVEYTPSEEMLEPADGKDQGKYAGEPRPAPTAQIPPLPGGR